MTELPTGRGGWWHDYVCPTHGVELGPPARGVYPCPRGCAFVGEPYASAWTVLEHQARARELRLCAHRHAAAGDPADLDRAVGLLDGYARLYPEVAALGWSERAQPWMLRGKLFAQALTEALWGAQVADAVRVLAAHPAGRRALTEPVADLLRGLLATVSDARRVLIDERGDFRNNYTAWLDCAGGLAAEALTRLGSTEDPVPWRESAFEHIRASVGDDGWEWEGATYYHVFVARAYLVHLAGTDPVALPVDVAARLIAMLRVLTDLAAPNGELPAIHDGPYRRDGALLELVEVCALGARLCPLPGLDAVAARAREQLGTADDGLDSVLDGWFDGPPLPVPPGPPRGPVHFGDVGYLVLRDPADTWQALVDAGPHGGSHGHLDKLSVYLYGADGPWQPAPGVPPYASPLRRGHYARTVAHPTIRVDDQDQRQCAGTVLVWEPGAATRAVVAADDAYPGVRLRRELVMTADYLLDVVRVDADEPRTVTLGLRPAGPLDVHALPEGGWRTRWSGPTPLHGLHDCTADSVMAAVPGRGPADDPSSPVAVADWTTTTDAALVSVYWPGPPNRVVAIELLPTAVRVHRHGGDHTEHVLEAR